MRCGSICFRFACLLAMGAFSAGCEAVSAVSYKVRGPDFVDAQYKLDSVPTVVMVENYQDPVSVIGDSEQLARYIEADLKEAGKKKPLVPLISSTKIYDLRSNEPVLYQKLKITEIGKSVGAKQVIYVELVSSNVQQMIGGDTLRGVAAARVKIVDCSNGTTKWPQEASGGFP